MELAVGVGQVVDLEALDEILDLFRPREQGRNRDQSAQIRGRTIA